MTIFKQFMQKVLDQNDRDGAVCSLVSKFTSLAQAEFSEIESVKDVVERISQQTLESAFFMQDYARNEKFRMSITSCFM